MEGLILLAFGFVIGYMVARRTNESDLQRKTIDHPAHPEQVSDPGPSESRRAIILREIDSDTFASIVGPDLQRQLRDQYLGRVQESPRAEETESPAPAPPAIITPDSVPEAASEPIYGPPVPVAPPAPAHPVASPDRSLPRPRAPRQPIRLDPAQVLLYLGAFLIVAAGLIYASFNWDQLEGGQKLALLAATTVGFIVVGLALLGNDRVRPAAETFVGIGALLIPSNIIAAVTILSDTPLRATLALQIGAVLATLLYAVFGWRTSATIYRYAAVISASIAIGVLPASLGAHRGWALPLLALAPALVIGAIDRLGERARPYRIPALRAAIGIPLIALAAAPVVGLPPAHDQWCLVAIFAGMAVSFGVVASMTRLAMPGYGSIVATLIAVVIATTGPDAEALRLAIPAVAGLLLLLLAMRGPRFYRTTLGQATTLGSVIAFGLAAIAPDPPDGEADRLATWAIAAAPGVIAAGWALIAVARRWSGLMLPAIVLAYVSHGLALDRLDRFDSATAFLAWMLPGTIVAATIPALAARLSGLPEQRSHSFFLWLGFGAISLAMGSLPILAMGVLDRPTRALGVGYLLVFMVAAVVAAQQHRQRLPLAIAAGWLVAAVLVTLAPVPVADVYRWPLLAGIFSALALAMPLLEAATWWRRPGNLRWPTLVLSGAAGVTAAPMLIWIGELFIERQSLDDARWWLAYILTLAVAAVVFGLYARYRYPLATTAVSAVTGILAISMALRAGVIRFDPDPLIWPAIGIGIGLAFAIAADRLDRRQLVLATLWSRWVAGYAALLLLLSLLWAVAQTVGYIFAAWTSATVAHGDEPIWWTPFLVAYVAMALTAHWLARRRSDPLLTIGIAVSATSAALAASLVLSAGMARFEPEPLIWTAIGLALATLVAAAALRISDLRTEVARRWSVAVALMAVVLAVPSLLWAIPNTLACLASGWTDIDIPHGDDFRWWLPLLGAYIFLALAANWAARRYDLALPTVVTAASGLTGIALATRMITTDTFTWTVVGLAIGVAALVAWAVLRGDDGPSGYRAGWIAVARVVAALVPISLAVNVVAGIAGEIDPWRNVALYAVLTIGAAVASVRMRLPEGLYASTGALGLTVLFILLTPQVSTTDGLLIPAAIAWVLVVGSLAPRLSLPWSRPLEYSGYAFGAAPILVPMLRAELAWSLDSTVYQRVTMAFVSLGLVTGLAAMVRRSPVRASVAIPLVMVGALRQVATYEPASWQPYAIVLAIALAATGLAWRRTSRVSDPLYATAGAVLIGVPFVESFTIGGTIDAFIAGGYAILVVVLGLVVRRQEPVAVGVVGVTLVALRQLVDTAMAYESWQVLGIAGAILLIGGTIILVIRDSLRRWWESGRRLWETLG